MTAFRLEKFIETEDSLYARLSEREQEVLRLIAAGLSNKKIVDTLFISMSTVKTHLQNIYGKLNVHSRTEAIAKTANLLKKNKKQNLNTISCCFGSIAYLQHRI